MKRNFLLMLLLTLLPLAGWAVVAGDAVKVGNYTFTLSSKLVVLENTRAAATATAPEILSVDPAVSWEPGRIYDANGQIVEDEVFTEVGNYFRQVTLTPSGDNATPVSVFVPFTVGKKVGTEIVWNEDTYQASQLYGFEKQYHLGYPTYDVWDPVNKEKKDVAPSDENGYVYSIEPLVRGTQYGSLFDSPFVGFVVPEGTEGTYHLGVKVQGVTKGFMRIPLAAETTEDAQNYMFWTFAATGNVNHPTDGGFLFATLMGGELSDWRFSTSTNMETGVTTINKYDPETTSATEAEYVEETMPATAEWDEGELEEAIGFYLVAPQDPFNLNVTVTNPTLAYTNSVKDPGLVVYVGETQISPKSSTTADGYEVTWYKDGEAAELIDPGYYMGVVTYNGKVAIVDFTITRAEQEVILNPAYVEKVYGKPDPAPKFKQEGGQVYGDIEEEIMQFLVLKRSDEDPVATREDVGDHKYYIDFTDEYRAGKCNYEITILQNHSILTIIPKPLSIQVTAETATKEYKKTDPAFKYVVDEGLTGQLEFEDADKASGTPSATDIITSITREKAGTTEGEVVSADGYKFTATSKNYKVTVTNNFTITPATDLSGLKVQFAKEPNSTVYLDGAAYTYTGAAQTPAFKVIDTDADPDYELVAGEDYWATGTEHMPVYANNTDVTNAATVTVTLTGNYTGEVVGTFAIEKAELTVAAKSYTVEPAAYEYVITGWVAEENADNQAARNTTGDNAVTYFNAPESGVVTKGNEIESGVFELVVNTSGFEAKNYKFKAQNGLLALNGTQVINVIATRFYKEYDGVDVTSEDLKNNIEVRDANNRQILDFPENKLSLANGPIYEIAKKATGRKHYGNATATGANEGYYDITLRGPSVIQGYTINWIGLQNGCEIDFRSIVLKADDKTKVYGAAVPTLTAQVVPGEEGDDEKIHGGLIGNDTETSIGLVNQNGYYVSLPNPPYRRRANNIWDINGEHATINEGGIDSRYNITPVTTAQNAVYGNYRVTTAVGKLAVTKASVLIAAADATKQFGTADPDFTITVTPADDGTPASVATVANMNGFWTIARTDKDAANGAGETVGAHETLKLTLTDAGKNAENFNITASTENGTLTITEAELKVKAHGQWINYGEEINLYDVEITKPSVDGLATVLKWNKVTTDPETGQPIPLTDAQTAENNAIKALGHLEVLEGKMEIGTNYDAFKFVVDDANYVIAPDKQEGQQTIHGFTNNTLLVYPLTVIPLDKDMLAEILTNKALTPKTLTKVLQDHQGCTVDVILPRRPMKANDWYAWVLPFEVKQRDIFTNDKWGYGAIEPLDEARTTAQSVAFTLTVQPIPANTPFIVKVDKDIVATRQLGTPETTVAMDEIIMRGVEIGELNYLEENPASGSASTVQFIGLYNETEPGDLDNSALTLRRYSKELPSSQWASLPLEWWPAASNVTLNRTYGYLQFPNANAAREAQIFIQEPDGSYTAINGVNADASVNNDAIYNLSGQRVNKAQKGIYIMDGKKVLVK